MTESDKRVATQKRMLASFKTLLSNYKSSFVECSWGASCAYVECTDCPFNSNSNLQAFKDAILGED